LTNPLHASVKKEEVDYVNTDYQSVKLALFQYVERCYHRI